MAVSGPLSIAEIPWPRDERFLQGLHMSWTQQYAEYLGQDVAERLVGRLLDRGELYPETGSLVLGAFAGEDLAGVTSLRPLQGLSLITMLEVREAFRHQGIGRALVAELDSHAERLMAHVSIHRPSVRNFYRQLGFSLLPRAEVDHHGHLLEFDVVAK